MTEPLANVENDASDGPVPPVRRSRVLRVAMLFSVGVLTLLVIGVIALWVAWKRVQTPSHAIVELESAPPRLSRPAAPTGEYIGSEACTPCHTRIAETYRGHPMSRSMGEITAGDLPKLDGGSIEFTTVPSRRYRVEAHYSEETESHQVLHHEVGLSTDGEVIFDQAEPVRYIIGSGTRGRAFVIDRDGFLFMSPISWYAKGSKWDLSPEYRPEGHPRFERPASERCLTCHAGRQSYADLKTTEVAQRYKDPPFAELSIGCERCHGPGAEHVHFRKVKQPQSAKDPIINPARLDPPRRESVCNQCHLQGAFQILRYGKHHDDFRPGDHLGDVWSVFVSGTGVAEVNATLAVSHVEQMTASRCYQESRGALGCISCHDPHVFPKENERAAHYSAKCQKCHARQGCTLPEEKRLAAPFAGTCAACHMPSLAARDVPHTAQTDHRLLRDPSARKVATKTSAEEGLMLFDQAYCPLSDVELSRAQGLVVAIQAELQSNRALANQAESLLRPAGLAAPDDVDVLDSLAAMLALQGNTVTAISIWEEILEIEPQRQVALYSLATHYHHRGELPKAGEYLDRLLGVNPWHEEAIRKRADVYARLGQIAKSREWAERSIDLNPSTPQSHLFLGDALDRLGDGEAARQSRLRAKLLGSAPIP